VGVDPTRKGARPTATMQSDGDGPALSARSGSRSSASIGSSRRRFRCETRSVRCEDFFPTSSGHKTQKTRHTGTATKEKHVNTSRSGVSRARGSGQRPPLLLVYNKITHSTRPRTRLVQTRGEGLTFAHRHPHGNGGRGRDRFIHRPSPSSLAVLLQRTSAATVAPSSLIPSSPTYTRLSYGAQCPLAIRLPM
jgi:hypothetical protein